VVRSKIVDLPERPRSTAVGLRAIAVAAAGIAMVSVVAAMPGSPYQPSLTPNGQPSGPLRAIAEAIGLPHLTGNLLLVVSTLVMIGAVTAFLWLLRASFRGQVSVRAVAVLVIGAHALLLLLPLLFSRDVYSYAFYGRIAGIYHANPYVQTPLDHSSDLLWNFVGPKWVDTPAVYGPGFTTLSSFMARLLRTPADHVEAYRILAVLVSLTTSGLIVWVARRLWPERTAFALVAFGANPVVLFHSVASGHNDLLVALSVVGALALVVKGRELPAIAVLTLGAMIKATAFLPLALLIVWCIARRPASDRRRVAFTHLGLVAAIGLAFALPYLQRSDPSLGMFELAGHEGWLAPSMAVQRLLDTLTFGTMGWIARLGFVAVLAVGVLAIGREVWRRGSSMTAQAHGAAWGWSLLLLTLLGPVLLPWYPVWALPLAWLLPRPARTAIIATSGIMAVTLWSAEPLRFPGAFTLDLWVGHFIVTPVLLALLVWVVVDLRRRVLLGLPFEDSTAAGPTPREPDEHERVAQPAGQR
jgi:Glycosyltransferase family 87